MAAIGIYSLPSTTENRVIGSVRERFIDDVRPYVLLTSQWQQWSLFSPDPLRRVMRFRIERLRDGSWETIETIDHTTVRHFERAAKLKTMRRIEGPDTHADTRKRLLILTCRNHQLHAATPLRLQWEYFVIPKHDVPASLTWWRSWKPSWKSSVTADLLCPDPL